MRFSDILGETEEMKTFIDKARNFKSNDKEIHIFQQDIKN